MMDWKQLQSKTTSLQKYGVLGCALFCTLAVHWVMRTLKTTIFFKIAFPVSLGWIEGYGRIMQPLAKTCSPFFILGILYIYSKYLGVISKKRLLIITYSIFAGLFSVIGLVLAIRSLCGDLFLGWIPLACCGWSSFIIAECYGSVVIAMLWSYIISISSHDEARSIFPVLAGVAQSGAIGGALLTLVSDYVGGVYGCYISAVLLVMLILVCLLYITPIPVQDKSESTIIAAPHNFFHGLSLLFTNRYLLSVLVVSTAHDIVLQLLEYQMDAHLDMHPSYITESAFLYFQGCYGLCVTLCALLIAFFGTKRLVERIGIRYGLLVYPFVLACSMIVLILCGLFSISSTIVLPTVALLLIMSRAVGYAINNPLRDMLYIPTNDEVRFTCKGWIDMFGARVAKQLGAQINYVGAHMLSLLCVCGGMFGLGIIGVWLVAATYVALVYERHVAASSQTLDPILLDR